MADKICVTKGNWTDLYEPTLKEYQSTILSSFGAKPVDADKDENRVNVNVNFKIQQKHVRKYPQLSVGNYMKTYTKGAGSYISRKEKNGRWSDKIYTIETRHRDTSSTAQGGGGSFKIGNL